MFFELTHITSTHISLARAIHKAPSNHKKIRKYKPTVQENWYYLEYSINYHRSLWGEITNGKVLYR